MYVCRGPHGPDTYTIYVEGAANKTVNDLPLSKLLDVRWQLTPTSFNRDSSQAWTTTPEAVTDKMQNIIITHAE